MPWNWAISNIQFCTFKCSKLLRDMISWCVFYPPKKTQNGFFDSSAIHMNWVCWNIALFTITISEWGGFFLCHFLPMHIHKGRAAKVWKTAFIVLCSTYTMSHYTYMCFEYYLHTRIAWMCAQIFVCTSNNILTPTQTHTHKQHTSQHECDYLLTVMEMEVYRACLYTLVHQFFQHTENNGTWCLFSHAHSLTHTHTLPLLHGTNNKCGVLCSVYIYTGLVQLWNLNDTYTRYYTRSYFRSHLHRVSRVFRVYFRFYRNVLSLLLAIGANIFARCMLTFCACVCAYVA